MNYEQALVTKLEATTAITNLVGTRMYPNIIPQEVALPALAYQRISSERSQFHDGTVFYDTARVQITIRATTYASAKSVISALKTTLSGFKGTMGGAGGVTVFETNVENELDGYDQAAGHSTVRLDITALYKE